MNHKFGESGVAYGQLYFVRDTLNVLHKYNPELQVGMRIRVKEKKHRNRLPEYFFRASYIDHKCSYWNWLFNKIPSQHGVLSTNNWLL
jgi:hypothetical protein